MTLGSDAYEVVILGAGYAGLMAAFRLSGRNRLTRVALISECEIFVERIRLQERISGPLKARLPPFAALFAGTKIEFIHGRVESLDAERQHVRIDVDGRNRTVTFKRCIYALGSRIDVESVRGVAGRAFRLDPGRGAHCATALRAELEDFDRRSARVVVVGGANTATEAAAEIKATWPHADVTMVSSSRAGNYEKGEHVEKIARTALLRMGIHLIDGQTVSDVRAGDVLTKTGMVIPADICVWAGGVRAPAIARAAGLAVDEQDRIWAGPTLSSISHPQIIAVGDSAHPVASTGAAYRLSAFVALNSGAYAADAVLAGLGQRRLRPFSFSTYGQGVAIGNTGLGFFTYPDDLHAFFIVKGRKALLIRNAFVWFIMFLLKLEHRFPGAFSFFWLGRRRVSWKMARKDIDSRPGFATLHTEERQHLPVKA